MINYTEQKKITQTHNENKIIKQHKIIMNCDEK